MIPSFLQNILIPIKNEPPEENLQHKLHL